MTVAQTRPVSSLVAVFRRIVEAALPWYDPEETKRRDARGERVRQRAIATRVKAEDMKDRLRSDYAAYAARVRR